MARSTLSLGMFASAALSIARRRRGFSEGSAPPRRAATVISLIRRGNALPFLASIRSFLWRGLAPLGWAASEGGASNALSERGDFITALRAACSNVESEMHDVAVA